MKRIFLILSLFAVMANLYATDVISVIRQKGWLETAMLQWTPVEGAAKYSVSYSGEGVSGNADDMLILTVLTSGYPHSLMSRKNWSKEPERHTA